MLAALQWGATQLWPVTLAVLALVAAAVFFLYPPQLRALGAGWRWMLPSLRAAAMGALALSILHPILLHSRSAQEQGTLVVLFDCSMSMSVSDRSVGLDPNNHLRITGQLVSLADSLGRLPEGRRQRVAVVTQDDIRRLGAMLEDLSRSRRELEYARLTARQPQEAQARFDRLTADFLATARSAAQSARTVKSPNVIIQYLDRLSARPALDLDKWLRGIHVQFETLNRQALYSQDANDDRLYQSDDEVRLVCDELARMSRLELCWQTAAGEGGLLGRLPAEIPVAAFALGDRAVQLPLIREGEPAAEPPVDADGSQSDLTGAIRQALEQLGGQSVQGIVLFSDGRQVGGNGAIQAGLLSSGVPVFTVSAAAPTRLRDLAIERVDLPRSTFLNEMLTARLTIRNLNMDPAALRGGARLTVGDGPAVTAPLRLRDRRLEPLELRAKLDRPGLQKLTISVPIQEGEASATNNQVERWVRVVSQKLKVAAISGAPGWDYRYLRNALARTPWIELRQSIVAPGASLAITPNQIAEQDVIILSDVPHDALGPAQRDAIGQLLTRRGGSVIVIPGLSFPQEQYPADLLPYAPATARPAWRAWPGQSPGFHLTPAPGFESSDALQLDDVPETSRRRWDELEGFYRYLALPDLKPGVRKLLLERESQYPLLTETRVGAGRAFFFAMNETWRWREQGGDSEQDRFWLQLVRYAADEPYAVVNGPLSFDVDQPAAQPDEALRLRARLRPLDQDAPFPKQLDVSVVRAGTTLRTVSLLPMRARGDGRYNGTVADLSPGNYDLTLAAPAGMPAAGPLSLPLIIERNPEAEMANLSGDHDRLQAMADASGGRCLDLDQVNTLPQLLDEAHQRRALLTETPLWQSGYLFVFVLGCLATEWSLRKYLGLA